MPRWSAATRGDLTGLRIGVPERVLATGIDPEVRAAFDESVRVLAGLGATVRSVELPHSAAGIPVYYLVATAEASANLARYDGVRYGLRADAAGSIDAMYDRTRERRLRAGGEAPDHAGHLRALSAGYYDAYYLKAQQVRTLIRRDFETAFADVDAVAMPTSPTPAFRLGERTADPLQMYLADVFTVTAPLAGLPALSVPCGFTASRLPIGLQLTGRAWEEPTLFRMAAAYEQTTPWSGMRPGA